MAGSYEDLAKLVGLTEDNPQYQKLKPYLENLPMQPGAMAGITKMAAAKSVARLKPFFQRREILDALKLIKAAPKKALEPLSSMTSSGKIETGGPLSGRYHWPTTLSAPSIEVYTAPQSKYKFTLSEILGHEIGHSAKDVMLQKMGSSLQKFGSRWKGASEGLAEYLGEATAKKAGVPFTPAFPYGEYQQRMYEKMSSRGGSNPYLNVYKELKMYLAILNRGQTK